ncbi:hypothetical protein H0H81_001154 [Sphagnurus paluster]|uniref:CTLH/CRA C-terminal to LisH motif domain-containing protein n=1 Tax=Sphagnurus paluster TaxID=117069 RepID=A0A9P7GU36_9AGAR|nr:hypothetical protein H0H81_001154 [Sphagnurus paluster]
MEGPLKELVKLEKLTASKGKAPSISDSLDALLSSLHDVKNQLEKGQVDQDTLQQLSRTVEAKKRDIDDRQKEVYSSVSRLGKALDKYIRLLLSSHPPNPIPALTYAKAHLRPFFEEHEAELKRLMGCVAYLPLSKLQTSPYSDLASPSLHFELEPLFAKEYCASLGMSRQVPLRVVGDIGGGGALARIEKGRKVMRERKSEWSQTDELRVRSRSSFLDSDLDFL